MTAEHALSGALLVVALGQMIALVRIRADLRGRAGGPVTITWDLGDAFGKRRQSTIAGLDEQVRKIAGQPPITSTEKSRT